MKTTSRRDYLQKIYQRYRRARKDQKQHILDEFCTNCGYHRKYAIRLLNGPRPETKPERAQRRRRKVNYGAQVISILRVVWEAADYPWSVRLKASLPQWMSWIRRGFRPRPEIGEQLLRISRRAIDYRLRLRKHVLRKRIYGGTKPWTLLKQHIFAHHLLTLGVLAWSEEGASWDQSAGSKTVGFKVTKSHLFAKLCRV